MPIYYDDPEPLILGPNQHYSTPHNRLNPTDRTHTDTTQPALPNPPHTTHPPSPPHLPPRRYYAPLPSLPDHHHPTHPAHPTYHPEGTMHLCLRSPTTTHHDTTQPPSHPPIRDEGVVYHRRICSIVKKNKIKMPNGWRTIKSLVHKIRLHSRRGKGMAESFSREKLRHAPQKEGG